MQKILTHLSPVCNQKPSAQAFWLSPPADAAATTIFGGMNCLLSQKPFDFDLHLC